MVMIPRRPLGLMTVTEPDSQHYLSTLITVSVQQTVLVEFSSGISIG